jgi:hypothetical protein
LECGILVAGLMGNSMWSSEELKRLDRTILIIKKDGDVRGSLSLETVDERELWLRAIQTLNGTLTK